MRFGYEYSAFPLPLNSLCQSITSCMFWAVMCASAIFYGYLFSPRVILASGGGVFLVFFSGVWMEFVCGRCDYGRGGIYVDPLSMALFSNSSSIEIGSWLQPHRSVGDRIFPTECSSRIC